MPAKKSNPRKRSTNKKQATSSQHAAERMNNTRRIGGSARVPADENQRSNARFPGETPLTGEDRPPDRAGGKKRSRA